MLECCISAGVPIPFGYLFIEKGGFIGKTGDEGLEVVDQA